MNVVGIEGPWPQDAPCAWGAAVIEIGENLMNGASGYSAPERDIRPEVITKLETTIQIPDFNTMINPVFVVALRQSVEFSERLIAEASEGIDGFPFSTPLFCGFVVIGERSLDKLRTQFVVLIMRALTASVRMNPADRHTYIRIGLTINPRNDQIRNELLR